MATVESWTGNIADIGPVYPMLGTETLLVIIGLVSWIVWHVIQAKREDSVYEEEEKRFGDSETLQRLVDEEDPRNP